MATVVLNAYSKPYPFITNRIRAAVYLQSSPQAFVAQIIDSTSGHPERLWSFPGLPRDNYGFILDEIDGSDNALTNLAKFDVVPGQVDGELVRNDEQITVDLTPGLVAGTNTFTFDGTSGTPDYRGWDIVVSELTGRGILSTRLDYTWNHVTGIFTFKQTGDAFQHLTDYNIHFNCQVTPAGGSVPQQSTKVNDLQVILITANTTLTANHFGKILIIEPASDLITVTLPALSTVPQGRKMFVEIGGNNLACVKFLLSGSDIINFGSGSLYAYKSERFSIYKYARDVSTFEYRVSEPFGNFLSCGTSIGHDQITNNLFNVKLLNGTAELNTIYARIYNQIVLNLPLAQVCNFDDWSTGNNKYLYSFANSSDPANTNKFHFPDRRGLYERNNNTGKAGDYLNWTIVDHIHEESVGTLTDPSPFGKSNTIRHVGKYGGDGNGSTDLTGGIRAKDNTNFDATHIGTEIQPSSYLINRYVLI